MAVASSPRSGSLRCSALSAFICRAVMGSDTSLVLSDHAQPLSRAMVDQAPGVSFPPSAKKPAERALMSGAIEHRALCLPAVEVQHHPSLVDQDTSSVELRQTHQQSLDDSILE